jgi:hypothetical protein
MQQSEYRPNAGESQLGRKEVAATDEALPKREVHFPQLCGINDELRWLDRRARSELRPGDNGARAVSLAQISLRLSQLRRYHFDACVECQGQLWIG